MTNTKSFILKNIAVLIALVFTTDLSQAQSDYAQWEAAAKLNKAMLPLYGRLPKTAEEKANDSTFLAKISAMPEFDTRRKASDHLIDLGFQYYYRPDLKTAMYRFNQAWLLDSTNTDVYWGYGAIYMALGRYDLAKEQYDAGLAVDPKSPHLLTDLATFYMQQYYVLNDAPKLANMDNPKIVAQQDLDSAIIYLRRSYDVDAKDVNTVFKLSVCYWNKKDCDNAWKYYDETVALGGRPITADYTADLKKLCSHK
ncbi:MAG TPA: tetratricopeptide repeat protein [Ferruginibacter sp.]|nr:tetratricopeptide repeat protein [Ferruginibacter sp.]